VKWVVRRPHPAVRFLAGRYLGYEQHDVTLPLHRGLPSRHVTLIISLREPVRVLAQTGTVAAAGLVGGLHTDPVLITQERTQCGIHLELHPLGVRTLLGASSADLSGHVVALEDLGRPALAQLPDRLASVPSWSDRFRILDEILAAMAADPLNVSAELAQAWHLICGAAGRVRIADIADEIGWSRRHFTQKFQNETGLTPKQVARVLRFEYAGALLRRGQLDLSRLAVECGFYDQAHLSNEWRAFAGCSPRTWIREELPFLQDDDVLGCSD
jgi:AraC-like DNA-binding protein